MPDPVLAFRVLPEITPLTEFFWTSGRDGVLRFLQCQDCRELIHPPAPVCPACLATDVAPATVSGRARLHTFTVNHQQWIPDSRPYVIGLVEIQEQPSVRLTTNIVECPIDEVMIGMDLVVCFEEHDDVWLPLFRPA
jgi:uncharacterized OB-fold protein